MNEPTNANPDANDAVEESVVNESPLVALFGKTVSYTHQGTPYEGTVIGRDNRPPRRKDGDYLVVRPIKRAGDPIGLTPDTHYLQSGVDSWKVLD